MPLPRRRNRKGANMNIGVCGCGTIASWISDILNQLNSKTIVKYGVASAFAAECQPFADKWGWEKVYDSYDALMQDPAIDLVYIAVPNSFHHEVCLKALNYGKNVVCEKPFAVNDKQAAEMIALAEEKGLFLAEALWPSFLPSRQLIDDEIASGSIGQVTGAELVSLSYVLFLERVKRLDLGGGALLDMGPYMLGRMTDHFGLDIASIEGTFEHLDTGVDSRDDYTITYKDGKTVHCRSTIDTPHEEGQEYGQINGTKGSIWFDSISNPQDIRVLDLEGNVVKQIAVPPMIHGTEVPFIAGYEYEFLAFERALAEGRTECPEATHAQTLTIAHVMTELRRQANVVFPFE